MASLFYMPFRPAYDSAGISVPGGQAYFTLEGTNTSSPVYEDSALTVPLSNPLVANGVGKFPTAYLDDAVSYRVRIYAKNAEVGVDTPLEEMDPYSTSLFDGPLYASDRTELSDLPTTGGPALFSEPGREGTFVWSSANNAANVTADPQQGIYVPPATDTTGASGAWVRKFNGPVYPEWFGAIGDGATNEQAAIQAAINYQVGQLGGTVRFRAKTYRCNSALSWSGAPIELVGDGSGVQPTGGTILYFPNSVSASGCINAKNGAAGLGAGSALRRLRIKGGGGAAVSDANAALGLGCGVLWQCNGGTIDDVVVQSCEGNGFYILSSTGVADATINANNGTMRGLHCWNNSKNGFATAGVDSNRNTVVKLDCVSNGQFAIYENSSLGNTYLDPHGASNAGGLIRLGNVTRANVFIGVYKEADVSALALQIDAGGGGRNYADLRQVEGTTGVPGTVTITDSSATGDNVWISRGYYQNQGKFGTTNGTVGTVTIDDLGIVHYKGSFARFGSADAASNYDIYNSNGTILFYSDQSVGANFYSAGAVTFQYDSTGINLASGKALKYNGTAVFTTGILTAAAFPALTGDVTTSAGSLTTTLPAATVVAKVSGQALAPASVAIGSGTALTKAVVYTPTITPASVAAATVAEQTFTVTGLTTADKVIVNPPAIANATGIVGARVSAADTLAIRFVNPTAGALTPTSGTYTVLAFRS
jgi:hypothetical protein